jgi:hypothetical protein
MFAVQANTSTHRLLDCFQDSETTMSEDSSLKSDCVCIDSEFRIVLVGEPTAPEFESVAEVLLSAAPEATFRVACDLEQLAGDLRDDDVADLIVFVQIWSDEFSFSQVTTLPSVGLLTQLCCVYGPWCASDGRSRSDWPLALRVPLEHFRPEVVVTCARTLGLTQPDEALPDSQLIPWTAGRDEVFANRYSWQPQPLVAKLIGRTKPRRICVDTPDLALRQLWHDLFVRVGYHVEYGSDQAPCDLIFWDADPAGSSRDNADVIRLWSGLRAGAARSKIVVATGFRNPETVARWLALGAATVVSKLLSLREILAELERISE